MILSVLSLFFLVTFINATGKYTIDNSLQSSIGNESPLKELNFVIYPDSLNAEYNITAGYTVGNKAINFGIMLNKNKIQLICRDDKVSSDLAYYGLNEASILKEGISFHVQFSGKSPYQLNVLVGERGKTNKGLCKMKNILPQGGKTILSVISRHLISNKESILVPKARFDLPQVVTDEVTRIVKGDFSVKVTPSNLPAAIKQPSTSVRCSNTQFIFNFEEADDKAKSNVVCYDIDVDIDVGFDNSIDFNPEPYWIVLDDESVEWEKLG